MGNLFKRAGSTSVSETSSDNEHGHVNEITAIEETVGTGTDNEKIHINSERAHLPTKLLDQTDNATNVNLASTSAISNPEEISTQISNESDPPELEENEIAVQLNNCPVISILYYSPK